MDICLRTEQELIKNDCETMHQLAVGIHNPIFLMMIVPFYAISIRAIEDYWNIKLLDSNSDKRIYDLRNSLKIYQNKFRRIKIRFIETDVINDTAFRSVLRFSFLKKLNLHYNIGVYLTKDGKIIGNTQWIDSYFLVNREQDNVRRQKAIDTGYIIGSAIQRAYDLNDPSIKVKNIELGEVPKLGYLDFNTNRASTFFRGSWDKEVQLAFLHLLSLINFEKYILESVLPAGNEWLFRIKYVVLHYTILGIDSIYRHCNPDNKMSELETEVFQKITRDKWTLFSSDFRGCMMHYRLRDKNHTPLIKEKFFNETIPFNGLIESNFDGISFDTYFKALSNKQDEIEKFLESQFWIDGSKIQDLT